MKKRAIYVFRIFSILLAFFSTLNAHGQTEESLTIGVSYSQALEYLDQVISMSKAQDVNGLPHSMGTTPDDTVLLNIIGNKGDISEASLMIGYSKDIPKKTIYRNTAMLLRFIRNIVPEWSEAAVADWLSVSLKSSSSSGEVEEIIKGVKLISLASVKDYGVSTITVKHSNTTNFVTSRKNIVNVPIPDDEVGTIKRKTIFKMHELIILKNGKRIQTQGSWNEDGRVKYVIDGKIYDEIFENTVVRIEPLSVPDSRSSSAITDKNNIKKTTRLIIPSQPLQKNKNSHAYSDPIDDLFRQYSKHYVVKVLKEVTGGKVTIRKNRKYWVTRSPNFKYLSAHTVKIDLDKNKLSLGDFQVLVEKKAPELIKKELKTLNYLATKGAIIERVCLDENGSTTPKYIYGCPTEATLITFTKRHMDGKFVLVDVIAEKKSHSNTPSKVINRPKKYFNKNKTTITKTRSNECKKADSAFRIADRNYDALHPEEKTTMTMLVLMELARQADEACGD